MTCKEHTWSPTMYSPILVDYICDPIPRWVRFCTKCFRVEAKQAEDAKWRRSFWLFSKKQCMDILEDMKTEANKAIYSMRDK